MDANVTQILTVEGCLPAATISAAEFEKPALSYLFLIMAVPLSVALLCRETLLCSSASEGALDDAGACMVLPPAG